MNPPIGERVLTFSGITAKSAMASFVHRAKPEWRSDAKPMGE